MRVALAVKIPLRKSHSCPQSAEGSRDLSSRQLAFHGAFCLFLSAFFCPDRQLISCSEDGSVRIWEVREKQQLAAEPVPTGVCHPHKAMLFPLPPFSLFSLPLLPSFFHLI